MEKSPLHGLKVCLTRERQQSLHLQQQLEELGAEVLLCPVLQFEPPDDPGPLVRSLKELSSYDWIIFTSPNGVRFFFEALQARNLAPPDCKLACIGPGTQQALSQHGLTADLMPRESVAESLLEAFQSLPVKGARILLARAQEARMVLPDGLTERGALVDIVACYKTVKPQPSPTILGADWVIFMSASAARNFREIYAMDIACLCIGPVTAATAREVGFRRVLQADSYDQQGVVDKLLEAGRP